MLLNKLFLFLLLFCFCANLQAQEARAPFCAGVDVITPHMAGQLTEFNHFEGFRYANLFVDADSSYIIEVYYQIGENLMRQRIAITEQELGKMCQVIFDLDLVEPLSVGLDQSGRTELLLSSLSYGIFYYGWATPLAFGVSDEKAFLSSYFIIGGTSFFVPFIASENNKVTAAMGKGFSNGGMLGIGHGMSTYALLMGDDLSHEVFGMGVFFSVAEGFGMLKYAQVNNLSFGHMRLIGAGGSWGMMYGLGFPAIGNSESARVWAISTLATSGLGIFAADRYARSTPISDGDVSVISILGVLGAYVPMSILLSIDHNPQTDLLLATMISGSAATMAFGLHKARNYDYSIDDGAILVLTSMIGMLTSMGFTYLVSGDRADFTTYLLSTGIGATGMFFLADHLIRRGNSANRNITTGLQINFNPAAIYQKQSTKTEWENPYHPRQQPYLFRAAYRF